MNWFEPIIQVLSNHRHPHNANLPHALTRTQLINLLKSYPTPHNYEFSAKKIHSALSELIARDEILEGLGKRYCMAPPAVLTQDEKKVSSVRFQGDRAYLSLAHQILETNQNQCEVLIRPRVHRLQYIQDRLTHVGVRLITLSQQVDRLPKPRSISEAELRVPWGDNPFRQTNSKQPIQCYCPKVNATQYERWQVISKPPSTPSLLRLHSGNFLWYDSQSFYELEPNTAYLTAFWLDHDHDCPLKLVWDKPKGLLHLRQTSLPSVYARWIWALSEPDFEHKRTRFIKPANQPLIIEALQQLGCCLV